MPNGDWVNKLIFGDNLGIMRDLIPDESIDLIYLDPPFNSKASYNVLFEEKSGDASSAQIQAFDDFWHWDQESAEAYREAVTRGPGDVAKVMQGLRRFLGSSDMMAYLSMMAIRLVEMHRVLKPTGSIYLHCDPTASHYLKQVMDAVFGVKNFRNEIIWNYRKWPASKRQFQRNHDVIFFYSKTDSKERFFDHMVDPMPRADSTQKRFGDARIISSHSETGERLPSQVADEASKGVPRDDVWEISRVAPVKQLFPTQKPEKLISRIIRASSKPGDLVLDPFCGCGTTVVVAEELERRWIGIDITYLAVGLMRRRLEDAFREERSEYEIIGAPTTLTEAKKLKEVSHYQFELWAVDMVDAQPTNASGDKGIDGIIRFFDEPKGGDPKRLIVQVKSGHVTPSDVRDLRGTMEREEAVIAAFITLKEPTRGMRSEAASAGFYEPKHLAESYPRLQILTVQELFAGQQIQYPRLGRSTFRQAPRRSKRDATQGRLF